MQFSPKEQKRFRMKKYIREHIFDFCLECVLQALFVCLVLYFCGGTKYLLGILLSIAYTLGKACNELRCYRNDVLNLQIPEEKL